jgi:hypothetical protein
MYININNRAGSAIDRMPEARHQHDDEQGHSPNHEQQTNARPDLGRNAPHAPRAAETERSCQHLALQVKQRGTVVSLREGDGRGGHYHQAGAQQRAGDHQQGYICPRPRVLVAGNCARAHCVTSSIAAAKI